MPKHRPSGVVEQHWRQPLPSRRCNAWRKEVNRRYQCVYEWGHVDTYAHAYMWKGSQVKIHPPLSVEDVELLREAGHEVLGEEYEEIGLAKPDPTRCEAQRQSTPVGRYTWTCVLAPDGHTKHVFAVLPDEEISTSQFVQQIRGGR